MAMQTIGSSSTTRTRVMLAPEPGYVGSPVLKPLNRIASESPYFGFESKLQARPHCKMQTTIEELWATFSPFGSDTALATAARVATYLRCGSAADRHSSITPSNVVGLNGLRRHRVAPSLSAILRKSGLDTLRTGECVSGYRDQRHRGRVIVKHPDRFEAAHIGHEDIDDHHIEC